MIIIKPETSDQPDQETC